MIPKTTDNRQGNQPADTPAAAVVAVLVSVALIGAGLVTGRELMIDKNMFRGRLWVRPGLEWIGNLHWHGWMPYAAGGAVAVGLVLLAVSMKPRNREHIPTSTTPTLWLRAGDVARACTAAALRIPGVAEAHTRVGPRRVDVRIRTARDRAEAEAAVRDEVATTLADLRDIPHLRVQADTLRPSAEPNRQLTETADGR